MEQVNEITSSKLRNVTKLLDSMSAYTPPGANVSVTEEATTKDIAFTEAEADADYAVSVCPSWDTTAYVTNKATTGFRINFGTAAGASATVDWSIRR